MREFALINSHGKKWDLNKFQSFLHDIKGLGLERKAKYSLLGNIFVKESDETAQKRIQGKIKFDGYDIYKEFTRFIQHTPLILEYTSESTYQIRISIDKLSKSELETGGLYCDITMNALGNYYITKSAVSNLNYPDDSKTYPVTYPYVYYDAKHGYVEIESDSVIESGMKIILFGPLTNPTYSVQINGELVGKGIVNTDIAAGNKLVIDTSRMPYSISEYTEDNSYVRDLYAVSDFSTQRFFKIGYGINRISAVHEGESDMKMMVEAQIEYEAV